LLALAGGGIAVLLFYQRLVATVCGEFMSFWTQKSLPALAAGKMPRWIRSRSFSRACSADCSARFSSSRNTSRSWLGLGRLLRLSTLWLWTILFGVLNAVLSASVLPFVIAPGFGFVLMSTAGVCLYFGTQAWNAAPQSQPRAAQPPRKLQDKFT
jgi:hypothetical protein